MFILGVLGMEHLMEQLAYEGERAMKDDLNSPWSRSAVDNYLGIEQRPRS